MGGEEERAILGVWTREEFMDALAMSVITAIIGFFVVMISKMAAAYLTQHKWYNEEGD